MYRFHNSTIAEEIGKLLFVWYEYVGDIMQRVKTRTKRFLYFFLVIFFFVLVWVIKNTVYAQGDNLISNAPSFLVRIFSWVVGGGLLGALVRFSRRRYLQLKRFVDFTVAAIGLILCLPLFLIIAILIKVDSSGPVFFRQLRLGRGGRVFKIWKFRTMRENAEFETGPVWAEDADPRITRVGYFLRKSHLDELPQLINVFLGEMSLIGPRPERPEMTEIIAKHVPEFPKRLNVSPGITGLAQVRYSYGASIKDAARKLKYDLLYMRRVCLLLDLQIFLWTIARVITGEGAR